MGGTYVGGIEIQRRLRERAVEEGVEHRGAEGEVFHARDVQDGRAEDKGRQERRHAVVGALRFDVRPDGLFGGHFRGAVADVGVVGRAGFGRGDLGEGQIWFGDAVGGGASVDERCSRSKM